jgi:hypothetical protein
MSVNGPPVPQGWSSPAIRFWRDRLKRPFPSVTNDAMVLEEKWAPLLGILDETALDWVEIRQRAAEVLEFEARLLSKLLPEQEFADYVKKEEMDWFLIPESMRSAFEESLTVPTPSYGGAGPILKYYFTTIRQRCFRDHLTRIVERIFEE